MCATQCYNPHSIFVIAQVLELSTPVVQEPAQDFPVSGAIWISRFSDSKVHLHSNTPPSLRE